MNEVREKFQPIESMNTGFKKLVPSLIRRIDDLVGQKSVVIKMNMKLESELKQNKMTFK